MDHQEQIRLNGSVDWESELTGFDRSGMNGAAYCRERGLSYSAFGYHHRKRGASCVTELVAVPTDRVRKPEPPQIRVYWYGAVIELLPEFDAGALARVLTTVAGG